MYYRDAAAAAVVYDITSLVSILLIFHCWLFASFMCAMLCRESFSFFHILSHSWSLSKQLDASLIQFFVHLSGVPEIIDI